MSFIAPDLVHGSIYNGISNENSWTTLIQSVLCKESPEGEKEFYYLSHECRNEKVILMNNSPFSSIFKPFLISGLEGRFLTYTHENRYFSVSGPDSLASKNTTIPVIDSSRWITVPSFDNNWSSYVDCVQREATLLDYNSILSQCNNRSLLINNLFVRIVFPIDHEGSAVKATIFTPVKHLNFSRPDSNSGAEPFLQFTTADCLIPITPTISIVAVICGAVSLRTEFQYLECTFQIYDSIKDFDSILTPARLRYGGLKVLDGDFCFFCYGN